MLLRAAAAAVPDQACFKESLRLFPPGHISVREAVEDLSLGKAVIPRGTWIHVRMPSPFLHPPAPCMNPGCCPVATHQTCLCVGALCTLGCHSPAPSLQGPPDETQICSCAGMVMYQRSSSLWHAPLGAGGPVQHPARPERLEQGRRLHPRTLDRGLA